MRRLGLLVVLALLGWSGISPRPVAAEADRPIAVDILSVGVDDQPWVKVGFGDRNARLLLAGIEVAPCMLEAAARRLDGLASGQGGLLEFDEDRLDNTTQSLQGYLRVDGVMLNLILAREGYAVPRPAPGALRYRAELQNAADYARSRQLRLWSDCP